MFNVEMIETLSSFLASIHSFIHSIGHGHFHWIAPFDIYFYTINCWKYPFYMRWHSWHPMKSFFFISSAVQTIIISLIFSILCLLLISDAEQQHSLWWWRGRINGLWNCVQVFEEISPTYECCAHHLSHNDLSIIL